ncbi:hypothetical protein PQR64_33485 [Paraburkholderia phytofirmans]|uniref:hypothetical protein n=1 Tax=Paraburkholderia phytofirmans TaxID=261302 RepID=UPI0038B7E74A
MRRESLRKRRGEVRPRVVMVGTPRREERRNPGYHGCRPGHTLSASIRRNGRERQARLIIAAARCDIEVATEITRPKLSIDDAVSAKSVISSVQLISARPGGGVQSKAKRPKHCA